MDDRIQGKTGEAPYVYLYVTPDPRNTPGEGKSFEQSRMGFDAWDVESRSPPKNFNKKGI